MSSKKQVFTRALIGGLALDTIFLYVLYSTSRGDLQFFVDHLIAVLSLAIVILSATYFAMGVEHKEHDEWHKSMKANIHYPLRATFERNVSSVEGERRKNRIHRVI